MLIYVNTTSKQRKNKKPTSKQAALRESWAKLLSKYDVKPNSTARASKQPSPVRDVKREERV